MKNTNFTGIQLDNFYDQECEIFRVVFLYEHEHIARFSNLQKIILSVRLVLVITTRTQCPWLAAISHINSGTNSHPTIINVVCKCLRQFLGTSFGVATATLSREKESDFFLKSRSFQNFQNFFQELTWSQ